MLSDDSRSLIGVQDIPPLDMPLCETASHIKENFDYNCLLNYHLWLVMAVIIETQGASWGLITN